MKVVIIGSGNVATVLGKKILNAGHSIEQVISKTRSNALGLATILNSLANDNLFEINKKSDLYIIAVSDHLVEEVASNLRLQNKLVVHTAASVSMDVLKNTGGSYGILYPVQSLKKELPYLPKIPIAIDGNLPETIDVLRQFASVWASDVSIANDEQRAKLHVAAVLTSNFINHLCTLAEIYCQKENIDFKMLLPLIEETVGRLKNFSPADVQTGPAVRGDVKTIDKHLQLLSTYPDLKLLYIKLTESIINYHNGQGS